MIQKLFLLVFCVIDVFGSLIVQTNSGLVIGKLMTADSINYYAYQGIPYAEPPVGELRFMPPIRNHPWQGVLDATHTRFVCPQPEGNYKRQDMSEDCLYLNIYVPQYRNNSLPVLVFVHGGQFKRESGNPEPIYGPQLLMQRDDIVVVTINFRLGALGFMSLDIKEASGNAGIKDIIMALKWINENILNFGGNPDKITVGGNSAGSAIVQFLLLSEKSNGLFHQAIMISGSALGYRFLSLHPKENALALGKELDLNTGDSHELLKQLKQVDSFDIVYAQENIGNNDSRNGFRPFAPFVPSIEIHYKDALITRHPLQILNTGIPQNVPMFIGFNTHEGINMLPTIQSNQSLIDNLNENFELCIPSNIEYPYGSTESINLAKNIRQFYFDNNNITLSNIEPFVELVRDTQYAYSINSWIELHKATEDSSPIYYYLFGFDDVLNWYKLNNHVQYPGTSHGDDLGYIFETKVTKSILGHLESHTTALLNLIQDLVVSFISTGKPMFNGKEWPEYRKEKTYLYIDNYQSYSTGGPPFPNHTIFWNNIYKQYSRYVKEGGALEMKIVP